MYDLELTDKLSCVNLSLDVSGSHCHGCRWYSQFGTLLGKPLEN